MLIPACMGRTMRIVSTRSPALAGINGWAQWSPRGASMLISCPECNTKVSDKAHVCPHCGFRIDTLVSCPDCGKLDQVMPQAEGAG